jgi:hypothetical protein
MTDGQDTDVWVGVTVLPQAQVAHVELFDNEGSARAYVEYAEAEAPDKAVVWTECAPSEIKTEFNK